MKDVDCAFLRAVPPTRARIVEQPAISTAELVRLWQRSGVITHYRPRSRLDAYVGIIVLVAVIAVCFGYLLGKGAF